MPDDPYRDIDDLLKLIGVAGDMAFLESQKNPTATMADNVRSAMREILKCGISNGMIQVAHADFWPHLIATSPPYEGF